MNRIENFRSCVKRGLNGPVSGSSQFTLMQVSEQVFRCNKGGDADRFQAVLKDVEAVSIIYSELTGRTA